MGRLAIAALLPVPLLCSSCFLWTTRNDGETMKQELAHLEDRIAQVEDESAQRGQKLEEMIARARTEVVSLEETLTRATRILARNSADFGAEMESLKDRLGESDGAFAEIRHELEQMNGRVEDAGRRVNEFALAAGLDLPVDESRVPANAPDHFKMIKESLEAERYGECRSFAKIFHDRYPKDERADDVQYMIAGSYIAQKRWAKALGALRRFTDLYPKSELTAEVLFEMATAFFQLGDCTDARVLVEAIASRHKGSPFAPKAQELLETMNRQKSRCTS